MRNAEWQKGEAGCELRAADGWRTLPSTSAMSRSLFSSCFALFGAASLIPPTVRGQSADDKFRSGLAAKVQALEKSNVGAEEGIDGWFFVTSELRMLSVGKFWGPDAVRVSRSSKPEQADPLPAILDFNQQLKERGIALIVVPVPPKAEIYPEKVTGDISGSKRAVVLPALTGDPDPALAAFYEELRKGGVDVIDLAPTFRKEKAGEHGPVFCKTDTHWSGAGCVLAAREIANDVNGRLGIAVTGPVKKYAADWKEASIDGDLGSMLDASAKKPGAEKIFVRQLQETVAPNPDSPVLLLGDSHTLVFHDFLAERAGLLDQLTAELGFVPDRIGIRGSGATPVRIDLYRRGIKEPGYLAKKKVVVWCFTAREFTEAAQGWQKLPVAK